MKKEKVNKTLEKLARGYCVSEVTEEYAMDGGELKLVKKKETRKDIAPDMKAIMVLMEEDDLSKKTDEELEEEKRKLIKIIKESEENGGIGEE